MRVGQVLSETSRNQSPRCQAGGLTNQVASIAPAIADTCAKEPLGAHFAKLDPMAVAKMEVTCGQVQSSLRAPKRPRSPLRDPDDPVDTVRNEKLVVYPAPYSSRGDSKAVGDLLNVRIR